MSVELTDLGRDGKGEKELGESPVGGDMWIPGQNANHPKGSGWINSFFRDFWLFLLKGNVVGNKPTHGFCSLDFIGIQRGIFRHQYENMDVSQFRGMGSHLWQFWS